MHLKGTVFRRKNGTFTVLSAPENDPKKGRAARRSLGTFESEQQARHRQVEYNNSLNKGTFRLSEVDTRNTRLSDYLDEWQGLLEDQQEAGVIALRTRRDYEMVMRLYVRPLLGNRRIGQLTTPEIRQWLYQLKGRGLSDRTVQKAYRTLHRALGDSDLPDNPVTLPKRFRPKIRTTKRIVRPTVEQVNEFLRHTESCDLPLTRHLYPLWRIAATCGLRRAELCGLDWSDIDWETGTLRIERTIQVDGYRPFVKRPKSDASVRVIGLDPATVAVLKAHRRRQAEHRLAAGTSWQDPFDLDLMLRWNHLGSLVNPCDLTGQFPKEWRHADLPAGPSLHGLRHSHGSALLNDGEPVTWVAARMGHTPEVLLRIYADELDPMKRRATLAGTAASLYPPSVGSVETGT